MRTFNHRHVPRSFGPWLIPWSLFIPIAAPVEPCRIEVLPRPHELRLMTTLFHLPPTPTGSRHAAQEWTRSGRSWVKQSTPQIHRADPTGVPSRETQADAPPQNNTHDGTPTGFVIGRCRRSHGTQESTRSARHSWAARRKPLGLGEQVYVMDEQPLWLL